MIAAGGRAVRNLQILVAVAVSIASTAGFSQQPSMDQWVGTWKRNIARSAYSPGPAPQGEQIVRMDIAKGLLQVTENGFDAQGQPARSVYVVDFNGTEHTVDPARGLTRTYRRLDERRFEGVNRVKGEETTMIEYALAADGRSCTLTTTGITAQGQLVHHVVVYEKQ